MERFNFLYGFIGTNRTGKSSVAKNLAITWKKSNPDGLIIGHDPQDNFSDIVDTFIQPGDDEWAIKCCQYRNCLLLLDDFRLINESNRPVKGLQDILYFRAKWNMDIIVIQHNPSLVINAVAHFISHYFIFMTNAQEGSFKSKIPNYSLCIAASELVNKHVSIFGRGAWPRFPYIIVDCEKQKLIAINMDKKLSSVNNPVKLNSGNNNLKQK